MGVLGTRTTLLLEEFRSQTLVLPIWFDRGAVYLIDQRALPQQEIVRRIDRVSDLVAAIQNMTIRGSGALGLCGAWGMLLAAYNAHGTRQSILEAAQLLREARPTAINLRNTVDEIVNAMTDTGERLLWTLETRVLEIVGRQLRFEYQLGEYGATLIHDGDQVLTHCHSGALAGAGYGGRVISVLRHAFAQGKQIHVFVSETRPFLQGARLTAWELSKLGIPYTIITDGMSGYCMQQRLITLVLVGSDRVAANGDLVNKVGTYTHAVLAQKHRIPFFTVTSQHTIDFNTSCGDDIPIEWREAREVTHCQGELTTLPNAHAIYPAFDITPADLISGIITERGIIKAPYRINLRETFAVP